MRKFTELHMAVGPVCSGKSTWAMDKYAQLKETSSAAYYCFTTKKLSQPRRKTFYARSGRTVQGWEVNYLQQIHPETQFVIVDEIQFSIFHLSHKLLANTYIFDYLTTAFAEIAPNRKFFFSGLDLDWQDQPFLATGFFMALADSVFKMRARCQRCESPASLSEKLSGGEEIFNEAAVYQPICSCCRLAITTRPKMKV